MPTDNWGGIALLAIHEKPHMSFASEFKEFALKGNVMDLAVGVIIGAAFGKIVAPLTDDIIMPASIAAPRTVAAGGRRINKRTQTGSSSNASIGRWCNWESNTRGKR